MVCTCNDTTQYDFISTAMRKYLGTYGKHFTRELCRDAVSMMTDRSGKAVEMMDKDALKAMLEKHSVRLENNSLWDAVYACCMVKADRWGSSVDDEAHLALAVKDEMDDPDGYDGRLFTHWYADCCRKGIVIDWEDYL